MPIKILLVDDHAVVRSGLSKFLMVNKDLKLVGEAGDGEEAVQKVSLYKPDVVLMDLMMPVMDGLAAFDAIRALCETENWDMPAVVFCTGHAPPGRVQEIVQGNPAHCLILKPVDAGHMLHALASRLPP